MWLLQEKETPKLTLVEQFLSVESFQWFVRDNYHTCGINNYLLIQIGVYCPVTLRDGTHTCVIQWSHSS